MKRNYSAKKTSHTLCEHNLPLLQRENEPLCALEYLNRFVAPKPIARLRRVRQRLYLVFGSGDRLECCCESCGESHGDDTSFVREIKDLALGRRALRFRLDPQSGHLVVWFARGNHLHLHRNALARFRPRRAPQPLHLRHTSPQQTHPKENKS